MSINRRRFLQFLTAALATLELSLYSKKGISASQKRHMGIIPATGEAVPVIGMGSWKTFNVGLNQQLRDRRVEVLREFFNHGGGMIDSSPMYGSSEAVIGYCLGKLKPEGSLFSASKVWTNSQPQGMTQVADSKRLWGLNTMDLMQVHNLVSWSEHLETLRQKQAEGDIRYVGITTSHGRRHDLFEKILATEKLDFIQLTYNILDRQVEKRLLPLARERQVAVIANMPFDKGDLFDRYAAYPLPEWAHEIDCANWAQFFLKFVVSHPAITCAIPATSQVMHMRENMGAGSGIMPDQSMRKKMIEYIRSL